MPAVSALRGRPAQPVPAPPLPPPASPAVTFINMPNAPVILDLGPEIVIDGEPGQRMRKCLTPVITPGRHVVHWDYSYVTRYIAEIDVAPGENFIEPKFQYLNLPSVSRHVSWSAEGPNHDEAQRTETYPVYTKDLTRTGNTVDMAITIDIAPDAANPEQVMFTYTWKLVLNGREISTGTLTETNPVANRETIRKQKVLYKDDYHYYALSYYIIGESTEFGIEDAFREYLKEE
ncbi:MAG: hypothetical protein ABIF71_02375 [Planctomycetota bacterium]